VKVVVVGGGFAGIAAALAARRAGAQVSVVHQGAGASALYAGVVDGALEPADDAQRAALTELGRALGLRLHAKTLIATREGVVRSATGADRALLDLTLLAGRRIGVVDVPRDDWDGRLLVRSFAASAWARHTGTQFEVVPLELLEKGHQRRVSAYDFAASFERPERPGWLSELLKAHKGPDAWLFGPWLGVTQDLSSQLSSAVGVPVGEVTSPPGGAAGARFELRRDQLLRGLEVEVVVERAQRVVVEKTKVTVSLGAGVELEGDALVLACGGFVSGALELTGALSGAEQTGFELGIQGLPAVEVRGEHGPVSSLFGVDLAARGRALLERVGLRVDGAGNVSGLPRVFAAGDVTAPEAPSVGHALQSGLSAGAAAACTG
jgi:anaerobic glycerol-3-phosphate dehydrogenase